MREGSLELILCQDNKASTEMKACIPKVKPDTEYYV